MTTHVTSADCSHQAYLFVCRLYAASVWITTGQSVAVKKQAVCKFSLMSLAFVCGMFKCRSGNKLSLHTSVLLGGHMRDSHVSKADS